MSQLVLQFSAPVMIPQSDGAWLIKPGRPVVEEPEVRARAVARLLGVSSATVYRLKDEGHFTWRQASTGIIWFELKSVRAYKERGRHPAFF